MIKKRIAIIYDWMDKWGGVERMLLVLDEMYPDADWYTSYVDKDKAEWVKELGDSFRQLADCRNDKRLHKINTSFIQRLPSFIKKNRILSFPLYPYAFESFDLRGYDLVISITSSFAKSVITHSGTRHICILLTPTRWLWTQENNYKNEIPAFAGMTGLFLKSFVKYLKTWDFVVAQRPDKIISISQTVADRCQKYYNRKSEVIYPPFDFKYWSAIKSEIQNKQSIIPDPLVRSLRRPPRRAEGETGIESSDSEDEASRIVGKNLAKKVMDPSSDFHRDQNYNGKYYLVVSRLESYKKVDLVINTFNELPDKQLIIVGKGTLLSKLKKVAGKNIQFVQDATDQELADYYSKARALIMSQEEDFGYVALEAQFFGCPVIAYGKGGSRETVVAGKTGIFFSKQSVSSLLDAVAEFERRKYNLEGSQGLRIGGQVIVTKFSKEKFVHKLQSVIKDLIL